MSSFVAPGVTAAERLAQFVQRHSLPLDTLARQLDWPTAQLQQYLASETRRHRALADQEDQAVERVLTRYQIALAQRVLTNAPSKPLAPVYASQRRTSAPAQFGHYAKDRKSILMDDDQAGATSAAQETAHGANGHNRKRKRTMVAKEPASLKADKAASRLKPSRDMLCPIRIDVDVDGMRYQDTLLINAATTTLSPEEFAAQIAHDERLTENVKDAIAESIRRQLLSFTSFIDENAATVVDIRPIFLDLIVDGISLQDQFEWDINNESSAVQAFANTLCADLNLPGSFECAIAFSICEQVAAYRMAMYAQPWIGTSLARGGGAHVSTVYSMPPLEDVIRDIDETNQWQPVLSELSREEQQYLSARCDSRRSATSWRKPVLPNHHRSVKQRARRVHKEMKGPRPINPFIMFCQVQKDMFIKSKTKRSAADTRKIMGDMWRKCTDEEKEHYAQLTEVENEKRRREHILDVRDRAIADWEEEEAKRRGLMGQSVLEASTEHLRGLLLEAYMSERHEVDVKTERA